MVSIFALFSFVCTRSALGKKHNIADSCFTTLSSVQLLIMYNLVDKQNKIKKLLKKVGLGR